MYSVITGMVLLLLIQINKYKFYPNLTKAKLSANNKQ
jgi:hypothetical protein